MAVTRLWFPTHRFIPGLTPAPDSGWTNTSSIIRRWLQHRRGWDDQVTSPAVAFSVGQICIYGQYISSPMNAGIVFDNTWTVKMYMQVLESNIDDGAFSRMCIRILSRDGATVRATLLSNNNYGGIEFTTVATNRIFANGDALTIGSAYTTQHGDRLCVEFGAYDQSGVSPSVQFVIGPDSSDLPEDEASTSTTAGCWIEFSKDINFWNDLPTRFYFREATGAPGGITPSFDGGWSDNDGALRRFLDHKKDISEVSAVGTTITWNGGTTTALDRQYISGKLKAGQIFDPSVTFRGMNFVREVATTDNVTELWACVKIISSDGSTVRATLLPLARYGPTTSEFPTTSACQSRITFDGDACQTSYVTQADDRILVEIGYKDLSGPAGATDAQGRYGMGSQTDVPETEAITAGTTIGPWFEVSIPLFMNEATRFYFSVSDAEAVQPAIEGDWTYTSEFQRRRLRYEKDTTTITSGSTIGDYAVGDLALDRQYVSDKLAAGNVISSSITAKMQMLSRESVATDDVGAGILAIKIVSEDGGTIRQVWFPVNDYGPTSTEWPTTFTNNKWLDGDNRLVAYTTKFGDRIVVEYGYNDLGTGTTPAAASQIGCNAADAVEDEAATTGAPWIEFSYPFVFAGEDYRTVDMPQERPYALDVPPAEPFIEQPLFHDTGGGAPPAFVQKDFALDEFQLTKAEEVFYEQKAVEHLLKYVFNPFVQEDGPPIPAPVEPFIEQKQTEHILPYVPYPFAEGQYTLVEALKEPFLEQIPEKTPEFVQQTFTFGAEISPLEVPKSDVFYEQPAEKAPFFFSFVHQNPPLEAEKHLPEPIQGEVFAQRVFPFVIEQVYNFAFAEPYLEQAVFFERKPVPPFAGWVIDDSTSRIDLVPPIPLFDYDCIQFPIKPYEAKAFLEFVLRSRLMLEYIMASIETLEFELQAPKFLEFELQSYAV